MRDISKVPPWRLCLAPYLETSLRKLKVKDKLDNVQAPGSAPATAETSSASTGPAAGKKAPFISLGHFAGGRVEVHNSGQQSLECVEGAPPPDENVWLLQAPRMTIAILVVGTRGDVQPFLRLGQRLKADGHRVRLATHNQYEQYVCDGGLEFYPLGGDPKKLSSYMCQSNGRLLPNVFSQEERAQIPEKMGMLEEMLKNAWPAVSSPYPANGQDFQADAIIANPVAYGHVHVAEKLDVPVHLMFPQPWSPTGDFPHPLSLLGGGCTSQDFRPEGLDSAFRRAHNASTYYGVDEFLYAGMRFMINDFRSSIGLDRIEAGEDGAHILNTHAVPFAYQWSPLLIPRPLDYGPHLEVTGTIFSEEGSDYRPPPDLEAWLTECHNDDNPPVFVGFGSMMISQPEDLADAIVKAARGSNTRVLLQSSWSSFTVRDESEGKKLIYQLGNCPHDWLFKQVAAVVHHGGAGTAAAGIRAGVPTMICPFFGDQHLWAQAFVCKGLAVEPVPIQDLTPEVLEAAFRTLRGLDEEGKKMRARCREVGKLMQEEDGVLGAVDCFYRHLPLEGLVCDASLMLGPERDVRMARWYSKPLGLKLCPEALVSLRNALPKAVFDDCGFTRYHYGMAWGFAEARTFLSGVSQGWKNVTANYALAGLGLVAEPLKGSYEGAQENGIIGVVQGGLEGTARGLIQGFRHVLSTRRLFTRPISALRTAITGDGGRGGRPVHDEEMSLHHYVPATDPDPAESSHFLEAYKAVQALRQEWILHAPAEDRPGQHAPLPLKTVAALLVSLHYPAAVLESLATPLAPAGEVDKARADDAGKGAGGTPKRKNSASFDVFESEEPLSFEEVAVLLQPHGAPPKWRGVKLEELIKDVLSG